MALSVCAGSWYRVRFESWKINSLQNFSVFKKAITLWNKSVSSIFFNQIEGLQDTEGFTKLSDIFIGKIGRETSEINSVISRGAHHIIVPHLATGHTTEKHLRFFYLKDKKLNFTCILKPIYSSSLMPLIISLAFLVENVITEKVLVIPISTFATGGGL